VALKVLGNGKERLREVVEVFMYMQPESSSKYKMAQQKPTVDRQWQNSDRDKIVCGFWTIQVCNADHQVLGVVLKFLFQPQYPTSTMVKLVTMEQLKKALLSTYLLDCLNLIDEVLSVRIIHKHCHAEI
jgi:tagatose-1,6-bisphosphate aldolase non-catalytic subunit AgaZ/GatZ